jgi:hypothetical protein
MKLRFDLSLRSVFSCLALALILATPALAGPPLICHPINIGSAQSLPWPSDGGNLVGRSDYDVSHLVTDSLSLLSPDMPVLVRMETLRRATIYSQRNPAVAKQLLLSLHARTTTDENDALAAFDFGYLVECYKQAQLAHSQGLRAWGNGNWSNPAANVDGYALVKAAIGMRGQDPQMEFAAALIASERSRKDCREHIEKAVVGAKQDPLLAQNLASQFGKETVSEALANASSQNN